MKHGPIALLDEATPSSSSRRTSRLRQDRLQHPGGPGPRRARHRDRDRRQRGHPAPRDDVIFCEPRPSSRFRWRSCRCSSSRTNRASRGLTWDQPRTSAENRHRRVARARPRARGARRAIMAPRPATPHDPDPGSADPRLRLSTLRELGLRARCAARRAIEGLHFTPVLFASSARARTRPGRLPRLPRAERRLRRNLTRRATAGRAGMEVSGPRGRVRPRSSMPKLVYVRRP